MKVLMYLFGSAALSAADLIALVANLRSAWLFSRNDSIGNLAVMLAAWGVFGTCSAWPDLAAAAVMAGPAITSGWAMQKQTREELRWDRAAWNRIFPGDLHAYT